MAGTTILIGAALVALGLAAFAGTRATTSLIPAYVGAVLVLLGLLARNARYRKHVMHLAAAVGLLGFLAAAGRLGMSLARGTVPATAALVSLSLMALLCLAFVLLCVRSFIAARRDRPAGFDPGPASGPRP